MKLNKSTIQHLDHTYRLLDGQLSDQINKVRQNIKKIHEARLNKPAEVCAYIALAFVFLNSCIFIVQLCRFCHRRNYQPVPAVSPATQPHVIQI